MSDEDVIENEVDETVDEEITEEVVDHSFAGERESKMDAIIKQNDDRNEGIGEHLEPDIEHNVEGHYEEEVVDTEEEDEPSFELPPGLHKNDAGEWVQTLRVDGEDIEQPYDVYHNQAQKYASGDIRLNQGVDFQKKLQVEQQELTDWATNLKAKEQELVDKFAEASPLPETGVVSDDSLNEEANEIVSSLFAGDEDIAREAVKKLLKRSSQTSEAPSINTDELTSKAADIALQTLDQRNRQAAEDSRKQSLVDAFAEFSTEFPDIVGDQALYKMADRETDVIAAANPTWTPNQVMQEAGKVVRQRTAKGVEDTDKGGDRLKHKANLQPIPQLRSGAVKTVPDADAEVNTSPKSVIDQMREARAGIRNEV